jgi:hypothetical protein
MVISGRVLEEFIKAVESFTTMDGIVVAGDCLGERRPFLETWRVADVSVEGDRVSWVLVGTDGSIEVIAHVDALISTGGDIDALAEGVAMTMMAETDQFDPAEDGPRLRVELPRGDPSLPDPRS